MLSFLWGSARDTVGGGIAAATFLKSRDLHTSVSRSSVKQTLQSDAQQQQQLLLLLLLLILLLLLLLLLLHCYCTS